MRYGCGIFEKSFLSLRSLCDPRVAGTPRWCNGNTPVFGAVFPGSSPGRGTSPQQCWGFFYAVSWPGPNGGSFPSGQGFELSLQFGDDSLQGVDRRDQ